MVLVAPEGLGWVGAAGKLHLGLGLGGGDYFLLLHTRFPIPRLMHRGFAIRGTVREPFAATEWDPTAMMLDRWRLNPLSPL